MFGLFYKLNQSISNVMLWIYLLILSYFVRVLSMHFHFFVFDVNNQRRSLYQVTNILEAPGYLSQSLLDRNIKDEK